MHAKGCVRIDCSRDHGIQFSNCAILALSIGIAIMHLSAVQQYTKSDIPAE
jgi:hypothetical protein